MKILFIENQSIFDSNALVLINPVNCLGIAGKGLALSFKQHYPDSYLKYKQYCKNKQLTIGSLFIDKVSTNKLIIYFPTKDHYKDKSEYSYIEQGMVTLIDFVKSKPITSIAIPKLGCGCGQLNFESVYLIICKHLFAIKHLSITIYFYI